MAGFVTATQVSLNVEAGSREEALAFLAKRGVELGFADDAEAVEKAFLAREAEAETGLVDGFAVPHAKSDAIKQAGIAFVKLTHKVEWPSFDQQPVDCLLALYVPAGEAGTTHLKLLSQSAVMLMKEDFRAKLRESDDPEEIAALIDAGLE